jgi:heme-degrading monooxygenase HmoA
MESTEIVRIWRGLARPEEADNYVRHLEHETFPQLSEIDGYVSASILRRDTPRGVEFLVTTRWRSMEAIRQFAGETVQVAVVPPAVQAMMVEYDAAVAHYQIVGSHWSDD